MGGFGDVRRVTMSLHQFTSSISYINCIIFHFYMEYMLYIYFQFDLFSCLFVVLNRFNLANLVTGSVPEEA